MSEAPSQMIPESEGRKPGPFRRFLRAYRKASGGSLLLSIILHSIILGVGAFLVVSQVVEERKISFGGGEPGPKGDVQHKVQMKRQTTSAPAPTKRITTTSAMANVALPDMPDIPMSMGPSVAGATGAGGFGASGGLGGGGGKGVGGPGTGFSNFKFFGLATKATSVILVIDISGSMVMPPKNPATWLKLEEEVERSLKGLPSTAKFNIILFSSDFRAFHDALTPANPSTVQDAMSFVKRESPVSVLKKGETPSRETWMQGRGLKHRGTRPSEAIKKAFAAKPDVILFLSDGEPDGEDPAKGVLALVRTEQQKLPKPLKISAVAYYASGGQSFMKTLARENNGEFKEIK